MDRRTHRQSGWWGYQYLSLSATACAWRLYQHHIDTVTVVSWNYLIWCLVWNYLICCVVWNLISSIWSINLWLWRDRCQIVRFTATGSINWIWYFWNLKFSLSHEFILWYNTLQIEVFIPGANPPFKHSLVHSSSHSPCCLLHFTWWFRHFLVHGGSSYHASSWS